MKTINQIGTVFFTDNLRSVTTERVRSALEASNLDPKLARDLSKRYCFSRAKNRLQADGLIDEIEETPERWTWQLSRRFRENQHLGYEFDSSFWFDKRSENVGADNPTLLERVSELFARYGGLHLPTDLTKLVRRIFDRQNGMVALRHSGAIYFVPAENRRLMHRVASFIKDLGGECITAEIGADNTLIRGKAQEMLVESVRKDLDSIVSEIRELSADNALLSARKAGNRWKELVAQLDRIKTFARSLNADTSELLRKARPFPRGPSWIWRWWRARILTSLPRWPTPASSTRRSDRLQRMHFRANSRRSVVRAYTPHCRRWISPQSVPTPCCHVWPHINPFCWRFN